MPPDDNISFFNSQRILQRLNRTTLIFIVLMFNYGWLKWFDVKGIVVEKQKYKIPARIFFWIVTILVIYQVGGDAWHESKETMRSFLALNMFFSLLMSYSYIFGKKPGNLVLFKFFD